MSITKVSVLMSAIAVSACGSFKKDESKKVETQKVVVSEQDAKAEGAKLPAIALIRVPVGADGKEIHDDAEMRLVNGKTTLSEENVASTFAAASAPAVTIDELDQTSSTESFLGWLGCGRKFRNRYGNSYGNSYGSYYGNNVGWNWQFYQPTYLNYGYSYGYSYGGSYGCGNSCGGFQTQTNNQYNYYQYDQNFGQTGYSNQGWNPSQTYTGGIY